MNKKEIPVIKFNDKDFKEKLSFMLWSTTGSSDYRNDRERPYNGQSWTDDGERGRTEVRGLTMRDIRDCLVKAMIVSSGRSVPDNWRTQDVYKIDFNNVDPLAICKNLSCEIEKMMGIFPNIGKLLDSEDSIKDLYESLD